MVYFLLYEIIRYLSAKGLILLKLSNYHIRYEKFLQKLKQARLDAGLTQKQAAELLGKPQPFVSKCETGERRVDFVELIVFAEIYGKPISFFEVGE